jgi:hypothetical protein
MELFIRNLDPSTTENDLRSFLGLLLAEHSLQTFDIRRTRKKGCAVVTIADLSKAQQFFSRYEQCQNALCFRMTNKQIFFSISRNVPNEWLLKSLQKSENDRLLRLLSNPKRSTHAPVTRKKPANLRLRALSCGRWEVHRAALQYVAFGSYESFGDVRVDRWSLTLTLAGNEDPTIRYEVLMDFYDMQSIAIDPVAGQTLVTVTLGVAPKVYTTDLIPAQDLNKILRALGVVDNIREPTKHRTRELGSVS